MIYSVVSSLMFLLLSAGASAAPRRMILSTEAVTATDGLHGIYSTKAATATDGLHGIYSTDAATSTDGLHGIYSTEAATSGNGLHGLHTASTFGSCAGASFGCPMDSSYYMCWPGSARCLMPQCSGCSPCCNPRPPVQTSCYDSDTSNWLPNGASINCKLGSGTRTCSNGAWQSNCVVSPGSKCWDVHSASYVDNNAVMSCTDGGTRMCSDGSWRVLSGTCTGQDYVDENGNEHVAVGVAPKH